MRIRDALQDTSNKPVTNREIGGHIADCIAAQEQFQRIARQGGDLELLMQATQQILALRAQARGEGLNHQDYPGIYRR